MCKIYIFCDIDKMTNEDIDICIKKLPEDRINKCNSYRNINDKKLCIVSYLLLQYGLKKQYGISCIPKFTYNSYGKPYLEDYKDIYFNISHTEGLAVCTIGKTETGIDCEEIYSYDDDLATTVCNFDELLRLRQSKNRDLDFTKIWTEKESYLKYLGAGLQIDPKEINVHIYSELVRAFIYHEKYIISHCGKKTETEYEITDYKDLF